MSTENNLFSAALQLNQPDLDLREYFCFEAEVWLLSGSCYLWFKMKEMFMIFCEKLRLNCSIEKHA